MATWRPWNHSGAAQSIPLVFCFDSVRHTNEFVVQMSARRRSRQSTARGQAGTLDFLLLMAGCAALAALGPARLD
jgi:hypothetical protein